MRGQRHASAALPQGMTRCPLYRRLGGREGIRSPDRPARSESLYRLRHRGQPYLNAPQILLRLTMIAAGVRGQSKKIPNFFFLMYCCTYNLIRLVSFKLLPPTVDTPLTAFFSSYGTSPGTCFAGWREGPVANFLLSPLPSEIGDLLGWTSTLGTRKSPQGPNLESRGAGARQSSLASPKIQG